MLLGSAGAHGNVLKVRPPLVFGESELSLFLDGCDRILGTLRDH
jgi:4-aminobutyrate aminotransferase-like enzyme